MQAICFRMDRETWISFSTFAACSSEQDECSVQLPSSYYRQVWSASYPGSTVQGQKVIIFLFKKRTCWHWFIVIVWRVDCPWVHSGEPQCVITEQCCKVKVFLWSWSHMSTPYRLTTAVVSEDSVTCESTWTTGSSTLTCAAELPSPYESGQVDAEQKILLWILVLSVRF